jgi:hypothetical protein
MDIVDGRWGADGEDKGRRARLWCFERKSGHLLEPFHGASKCTVKARRVSDSNFCAEAGLIAKIPVPALM